MRHCSIAGFFLTFVMATCCLALADESPVGLPETNYGKDVAPFLETYCLKCHGGDEPEAELSLERFRTKPNVQEDFAVWQSVLKMLIEREMPPDDSPQPSEQVLQTAIGTIQEEMAKFDCRNQPSNPGRVTLRRLNRTEYNNTIRDLLSIDFQPADDFPSDDVGEGFDNIGDVLSLPPILLEKYLAAAEQIAVKTFASDEARDRILVHRAEEGGSRSEAARRNLRLFASRAFRRPVSDDELDRLYDLVRFTRSSGGSSDDGFQVAMQAILVSPHFLFRVELDPPAEDPDGIRELNDFELASRMSYFLWSSMPDEELFSLAREGKLRDAETRREQVVRMLQDPKAQSLVKDFAGQWLQLRDLVNMTPDPDRFPAFDEPLRAAMRRETELFFNTMIREDRSVLDFLDADFSYVNERLAQHYGIEGVKGDEFRRIDLPPQRRGVLTQGSVLLLTSNPTRTSPVKRGKWILDNILGEPPPPPPAGVEELQEDAELLGSLRERMEQHRSNESCAVCHRKMDALGFGLENFDAIGAWREFDGKFAIDPSGSMPGGGEFSSPKELMTILKQEKQQQFCRCLTEKLITFALGRGLQSHDRCAIDKILEELGNQEFRFSGLVTAIVFSDPFTKRELIGEP